MKVLIKGYYGFGNLGDDILMITTYKILKAKYPSANFFVFSNFNANLKGFRRESEYNHYIYGLLDASVCIIDWTYRGMFDLVVDGGGGVLFDQQKGSFLSHFRNILIRRMGIHKVAYIDHLLRGITRRPKRIAFKQRIGLGLGIGPYVFGSSLLYEHMVEMGSYNSLVVRDCVSFSFLHEIGFRGEKHLFTDLAFLSHLWIPDGFRIKSPKKFTGNIGVILMDWQDESEELFSAFWKFAEESRAKGCRITFFSFDENHDLQYSDYFRERAAFVRWQPRDMALVQFLRCLADQDIVITGRAHGAIIGGQLGVVPICLGKSEKLKQVAKMFRSSSIVISDPLNRDALHQSIETIRARHEHFLQALADDCAFNQEQANEMVALADRLLP